MAELHLRKACKSWRRQWQYQQRQQSWKFDACLGHSPYQLRQQRLRTFWDQQFEEKKQLRLLTKTLTVAFSFCSRGLSIILPWPASTCGRNRQQQFFSFVNVLTVSWPAIRRIRSINRMARLQRAKSTYLCWAFTKWMHSQCSGVLWKKAQESVCLGAHCFSQ